MDPAVFRPVPRGVGRALLLGAAGGAALGAVVEAPVLVAAAFGAIAAAIAVSVRQVRGVRVIATEQGVAVRGGGPALEARWEELRLAFGRSLRPDGAVQRHAVIADPRGRSFAFADLAGGPPPGPVAGADGQPVEVVDLRDAALLLALLVQRMPAWYVLPPELLEAPLASRPADESPFPPTLSPASAGERESERASAPTAGEAGQAGRRRRGGRGVGFLALLGKLGGTVLKALKTANLGWAAASAAAYGILFSWKFAAALLLQLFIHEYGHVHAMRRTGMRVRGMYFIPFLGALAVTDDSFRTRRQQAYVALSGPIWGAVVCLVPAGLFLWTRDPTFAAIAAWWALINLFNLLPIAPLDGGRVMQAFAFSFSSTLGVALSLLGLAAAVAAATWLGYGLVWLVVALGAMELVSESQARAGGRALRLLPDRARLGPAQYAYLRAVIAPPLRGGRPEALFARELERMERAARAEPMRAREMVAWGLGYAALAAGLLALVHFLGAVPGAATAARLLT
ncbi:MAG TPA: site-2 protease family protein [Anaeromyxobacteraceae bacterium]|nr:site-2 protease family protein [Anaeromyxobacteraceae bacterium]